MVGTCVFVVFVLFLIVFYVKLFLNYFIKNIHTYSILYVSGISSFLPFTIPSIYFILVPRVEGCCNKYLKMWKWL